MCNVLQEGLDSQLLDPFLGDDLIKYLIWGDVTRQSCFEENSDCNYFKK